MRIPIHAFSYMHSQLLEPDFSQEASLITITDLVYIFYLSLLNTQTAANTQSQTVFFTLGSV